MTPLYPQRPMVASANPANYNPAWGGHSNFGYAGETGAQTAARMLKEWEARGQQDLPRGADAQLAGGGGMWGMGGRGAVGGAGGGAGGGNGQIEQMRADMFNAINNQAGFFGQGNGSALSQAIMRQVYGSDAPFTPGVVNNMFSAQADASGAQAGREQEAIRRGFANSGIGGSGGQISAQVGAVRRHGAQTRNAKREIDTTAAVENYGARERAQQRMSQFLAQDAANRLASTQLGTGAMLQYQQTQGGMGGGFGGAGIPGGTIRAANVQGGMGNYTQQGGAGQSMGGAVTSRTEGWTPGQQQGAPQHFYGIGAPPQIYNQPIAIGGHANYPAPSGTSQVGGGYGTTSFAPQGVGSTGIPIVNGVAGGGSLGAAMLAGLNGGGYVPANYGPWALQQAQNLQFQPR